MIKNLSMNKLEEVMRIWLETNIDAHDFIDKKYWIQNYDLVKELLKEADVYIFEENDVIKGFVGIVENNYIGGIFVKKNYQREGIGKKLIDFCKNKYSYLTLHVFKKNHKAINFYNKNDFMILDELINEDTKESEYLMTFRKK
ncbi:N-acetyltransferase [Clostridium sp. C8]|uniref:N-acetyltransferase domain-containing protein n=1 Tax=bioreactor metagenome TaxID=1076179 RepID=A0A644VTM0_9ZZZZ|nr:N-acetyltransferase [Clostridium sp. C8]KLE15178.1 acetyltransferase [Clostridium sp. C8]